MHVCADGLIRLTFEELLSAPLVHLMSGLDAHAGRAAQDCGRITTLAGYTEWTSVSRPAVSLGWDWFYDPARGAGRCCRVGLPRSNVMLVDDQGRDKSWSLNLQRLATVVDALPWLEPDPIRFAGNQIE